MEKAEKLGIDVANLLMDEGALELLNAAREEAANDTSKAHS